MLTRIGPVRRLIQPVFVLGMMFVWLLGGCAEPTPPEPQWNAMTNYVPPPRRLRHSAAGVGLTPSITKTRSGSRLPAFIGEVPAQRSIGSSLPVGKTQLNPLPRQSIGTYQKRRTIGTQPGSKRIGRNPGRQSIGADSNTVSKTGQTLPIK